MKESAWLSVNDQLISGMFSGMSTLADQISSTIRSSLHTSTQSCRYLKNGKKTSLRFDCDIAGDELSGIVCVFRGRDPDVEVGLGQLDAGYLWWLRLHDIGDDETSGILMYPQLKFNLVGAK